MHGWTPFHHYAAYYNRYAIIEELLEADKSVGIYVADKTANRTALHMV